MSRALTPNILTAQDLEPQLGMARTACPAWGHTSVDFERRIDHDRLRRYRLSRTRQACRPPTPARSCSST
jgi:Xaa-Pro aminopeptidase